MNLGVAVDAFFIFHPERPMLPVSLEGTEPELRERVEDMLAEAGDVLWVRRAKDSQENQYQMWFIWDLALKQYGKKEVWKHAEIAAFPGTSQHTRKRAAAIDVMCIPGQEDYRAHLAKKNGLYSPIESCPHHLEKEGNRKPIKR